jgi:two-component system cell cycle response regulator CtrA
VHLTAKEYGILELLCLRKGTVLTKETFLNHLYGGGDEPELKIIDVFVCKLRKKLRDATGGDHFIETVWGRGYIIRDAVEAPARAAPPNPLPSNRPMDSRRATTPIALATAERERTPAAGS